MNAVAKPLHLTLGALACAVVALASFGGVRAAEGAPPAQAATPEDAFVDVVRVLQSPRCVNCHPNGDAPLQGEQHKRKHAQGITRDIERTGMTCQTCHRESLVSNDPGLPPALKGWRLPPASTPMIFEGRTPAQLCAQLKDPAHNGNHDLAHLLHHVGHDELVLYGWQRQGNRPTPPLPHAVFVARFQQWVDAGAPCPK